MKKNYFIFMLFFFLTLQLNAQDEIRVGLYENAPKIYIDKNGNAKGFFIDILEDIAHKEQWKLHYVKCKWAECINLLEDEKIDIMPDVAYTDERAKKFVFEDEPVISSWSVVYANKNAGIESILDLKGKKVAVLENTIQSYAMQDTLFKFGIKLLQYIKVKDFKTEFTMLNHGDVDAVIVNRFYELNHNLGDNVRKTNIVLRPSTIRYAFTKPNAYLADKVNGYLKQFRKDRNSILYTAEKKYLTPKKSTHIPKWLVWSFIGVTVLSIVLLFLVILFKRMVIKKSQELLEKEHMLLAQSKLASMGEMISLIAHQWRQPLSVISMNANNIRASIELEEMITPKEIIEFAQTASEEVKYLSETIDDFRNFFKQDRELTPVKISEIFHKMHKLYANSLISNNIKYTLHNQEDFEIKTHTNALIQVLLNLINNAKDALREKKKSNAKIIVTTKKVADSYSIKICDNAGGIPDELLTKIGTQYFTTKGENGTGLGIYMSKTIIEKHLGGTLSWQNTQDGVCFTIMLPKL